VSYRLDRRAYAGAFETVGAMDGAAGAYMGSNLLLQLLHAAIHGGDVFTAFSKAPAYARRSRPR